MSETLAMLYLSEVIFGEIEISCRVIDEFAKKKKAEMNSATTVIEFSKGIR